MHLALGNEVFAKAPGGSPALLRLLQRKAPMPASASPTAAYWDAAFFGLDRVERFRRAEPERRRALLETLGAALLEEALRIERAGMTFTARMSLMAESVGEQTLFSLFAAEEALHHRALSAFHPAGGAEGEGDAFARALKEMAARGPRAALFLIVQVVLEGWGLHHYRGLAAACRSAGLRKAFAGILRDEAKHHLGGKALVAATAFTPADLEYAVERLRGFLGAVQAGPVLFLEACEACLGPLDREARLRILAETSASDATQAKLDILCRLSAESGVEAVHRILERDGLFRLPAGGLEGSL